MKESSSRYSPFTVDNNKHINFASSNRMRQKPRVSRLFHIIGHVHLLHQVEDIKDLQSHVLPGDTYIDSRGNKHKNRKQTTGISYTCVKNKTFHKNPMFHTHTAYPIGIMEYSRDVDNTPFEGKAYGELTRTQRNCYVNVYLVLPGVATIYCGRTQVNGYSVTSSTYNGNGESNEETRGVWSTVEVKECVKNYVEEFCRRTLGDNTHHLKVDHLKVEWKKVERSATTETIDGIVRHTRTFKYVVPIISAACKCLD